MLHPTCVLATLRPLSPAPFLYGISATNHRKERFFVKNMPPDRPNGASKLLLRGLHIRYAATACAKRRSDRAHLCCFPATRCVLSTCRFARAFGPFVTPASKGRTGWTPGRCCCETLPHRRYRLPLRQHGHPYRKPLCGKFLAVTRGGRGFPRGLARSLQVWGPGGVHDGAGVVRCTLATHS